MSGLMLLRRNPSRQGLDGLLRLTTQWNIEDKEEAARERRRRERDRQLRDQYEEGGSHAPEPPEQEALTEQSSVRDHFMSLSTHRHPRPTYEDEDSDGLNQAEACLEELHLRQEGPGPEETAQGSLGAEDEVTAPPKGTPSPLALEEPAEQRSPPLSPTTKLIDRTESLNRSIQKSNSVKKSQPALPISTIDERLEQYTQAIETAGRTPKLARQASIELPSMAVASTKSRWEMGEVQAQSTAKTPSCKDIVAGDMSKKSLWEQKGGSKTSSTVKSTPSGKRYKFVATGHGKYEKVLVDEGAMP
ncbi:PREDICTED: lymphocyte-specific protein 1 [Galeopterus variegatus]|uniref:Lymphocyte-specific protein 1 n=1 Tax=Galeopterus variegatus TaxID=482537 RepID=A0ABM0R8D3_GALVR|nr:PREDICTED: lymphocyte-specific protein 1 [Galeopterus variegatus]